MGSGHRYRRGFRRLDRYFGSHEFQLSDQEDGPVFAIVDTNSNPEDVDYVIPANDDASKSIEVILDEICGAMAEGLEERKVEKIDAPEDKEEGEAAPKRRRVRRNEERAAAPEVEVKEDVKEETAPEA